MSSRQRVSRPLLLSVCLLLVPVLSACTAAAPSPRESSSAAPNSSASKLTAAQWATDLDTLDQQVRAIHPSPFAIHPEEAWVSGLSGLRSSIAMMSAEDAKVAIIRQVALLDTHSGVYPEEVGFHFYKLVFQEFSDGAWVTGADDPAIVGSRITAVNGHPIDEVLDALAPMVNGDNESGIRQSRRYIGAVPEILHSLGIVSDPAHPKFELALPDGSTKVADPAIGTYDEWDPLQRPPASAPDAAKRFEEPVYSAIAKDAFILNYNETGTDASERIAAMKAALKSHAAGRVILDMRNAGGGDYPATEDLQKALAVASLHERGKLVVITGTNNTSAGAALVSALKTSTRAIFVGQSPATRPLAFLDPVTFDLPNSHITVHVPQFELSLPGAKFIGNAVEPDRPVWSSGVDYFAGRDPGLAAALAIH